MRNPLDRDMTEHYPKTNSPQDAQQPQIQSVWRGVPVQRLGGFYYLGGQMRRNLAVITTIAGIITIILWALFLASVANADEFVPDTPEKQDLLIQAIYSAEGGERSEYPFGIRSVKCEGYADCRKVCLNTIRNNIKRWHDSGTADDYLTFLARRYAPIGVANDPKGLNANWLRNVRWFLNNSAHELASK